MPKAEGHSFEFVDKSHIQSDFLEVFDFESPDQYIKTETNRTMFFFHLAAQSLFR